MPDQDSFQNDNQGYGFGSMGWGNTSPMMPNYGYGMGNYGYYQQPMMPQPMPSPTISMPQQVPVADSWAAQGQYNRNYTMQLAQSNMMYGLNTALQGTMMAGSALAQQSASMMGRFQQKFDNATRPYQDYSLGNGSYLFESSLWRETMGRATAPNSFMRKLTVGARPEFMTETEYQRVLNASSNARWDTGSQINLGVHGLTAALSMTGIGIVPALALEAGAQVSDFFVGGTHSIARDKARREGALKSIYTRYGYGNAFLNQGQGADFEEWLHEESMPTYMARATAAKFGKDSKVAKLFRPDWTKDDAKEMMQELRLFQDTKMDVGEMKKAVEMGFKEIKEFAEVVKTTRAKAAEVMAQLKQIMPGVNVNDSRFQGMYTQIRDLSAMTGLAPETFLENAGIAKGLASQFGLNPTGTINSLNQLMASMTMMQSSGRTGTGLEGVNTQQQAITMQQYATQNMRSDPFMLASMFGGGEKDFMKAMGNVFGQMNTTGGKAKLMGGMLDMLYQDMDAGGNDVVAAMRMRVRELQRQVPGLDEDHAFKLAAKTMGIGPGDTYKALRAKYFQEEQTGTYLGAQAAIAKLKAGEDVGELKNLRGEEKEAKRAELLERFTSMFTDVSKHADMLKEYRSSAGDIESKVIRDNLYGLLGSKQIFDRDSSLQSQPRRRAMMTLGMLRQKQRDLNFAESQKDEFSAKRIRKEMDDIRSKASGILVSEDGMSFQDAKTDVGNLEKYITGLTEKQYLGLGLTKDQTGSAGSTRTTSAVQAEEFKKHVQGMLDKGADIEAVIQSAKEFVSKSHSLDSKKDSREIIQITNQLLGRTGLSKTVASRIDERYAESSDPAIRASQQVEKAMRYLGGEKMMADVAQDRHSGGTAYGGMKSGDALGKVKDKEAFTQKVKAILESNSDNIGDAIRQIKDLYLNSIDKEDKAKMLADNGLMDRSFNNLLHDVKVGDKQGDTAAARIHGRIQTRSMEGQDSTKFGTTAHYLRISAGGYVAGNKDSAIDKLISERITKAAHGKKEEEIVGSIRAEVGKRLASLRESGEITNMDKVQEAIESGVTESAGKDFLKDFSSDKALRRREIASLLGKVGLEGTKQESTYQVMRDYLNNVNSRLRGKGAQEMSAAEYFNTVEQASNLYKFYDKTKGTAALNALQRGRKDGSLTEEEKKRAQLENALLTNTKTRELLETWSGGKLSVGQVNVDGQQLSVFGDANQFQQGMQNISSKLPLEEIMKHSREWQTEMSNDKTDAATKAVQELNTLLSAINAKLGITKTEATASPKPDPRENAKGKDGKK